MKGNLVAACKECNNRKKYLLPFEWEEYLKRLKAADSEVIVEEVEDENT